MGRDRDGTGRDGMGWNGMGRDDTGWDGTGWDGMGRDDTGLDGTGRDETRRDGPGRDGTGRDGTVYGTGDHPGVFIHFFHLRHEYLAHANWFDHMPLLPPLERDQPPAEFSEVFASG